MGRGEVNRGRGRDSVAAPLSVTLLIAALLLAGCERQAKTPAGTAAGVAPKVIATVNGEPVTEDAFSAYRTLREQQSGPIADEAEERRIVLDEMIGKVLITQYATETGLDKDPAIVARLKEAHDNVLTQAVRQKLSSTQPIGEAQIQAEIAKTPGRPLKAHANAKPVIDINARADAYRRLRAGQLDALVVDLRGRAKITAEQGDGFRP